MANTHSGAEEEKYDYFSMVAMLYEMGNWDEETVLKRVHSYASDNNIDEAEVNEFLGRLIKKKEEKIEHTLEEKRKFLSVITFKNGEYKYGDAVILMNDDMVERYYDFESKSIGEEETEKIHEKLKHEKPVEEKVSDKKEKGSAAEEKPVDKKEEPKKEEKKETSTSTEEKSNPEKVDGEYSHKGGERTVVGGNSSTTHTRSNSTSNSHQGSGPKSEPQTEADYENTARNMGSAEQDSDVRHVDASPERIERLKKGKGKVKNFFLKSGIIVLTVMLTSTFSIPLIGGYLVLAHQIKEGKFNPPGAFGQGIKKVVETIMNIGKTKEEVEAEKAERGRSR